MTKSAWQAQLRMSNKGRVLATTGNALLILTNHPLWMGIFGYDERADEVQLLNEPPVHELRGDGYPRPLRDADETWIGRWLEQRYDVEIGAAKLHAAIVAAAEQNSFDRTRDYLSGLTWDGVSRLDTWVIDLLGAQDTELHRAIGAKWMISAVARALEPGCKADGVLTLEGPQGIGKSSALAALCEDDTWFCDQVPDLRDHKAAAEILQGPWIVELPELAAVGRAEVERVKAWITTQSDRYRSPWGRVAQSHPRRCVFAATTNADAYLRDSTGGRRWWPVRVGAIDVPRIRAERDQLWAEAAARYRAGERWHLTGKLERDATIEQEERRERDPWEDRLHDLLLDAWQVLPPPHRGDMHITVSSLIEKLGVEVGRQEPRHVQRVGRILQSLGWVRKQRRGDDDRRVWGYRPPTGWPDTSCHQDDEQGSGDVVTADEPTNHDACTTSPPVTTFSLYRNGRSENAGNDHGSRGAPGAPGDVVTARTGTDDYSAEDFADD